MAKELPYFKWQPSEYIKGDITLCSMSAQGVFSNICCFYWMRNCVMTLDDVKQRFNSYLIELYELTDTRNIIKIEIRNHIEYIKIDFLDQQFKKLSGISDMRSEFGKLAKGKRKQVQQKELIRTRKSISKAKAKLMLKGNNILLKENNKNNNKNNNIYIAAKAKLMLSPIEPFDTPTFRRAWRRWKRYKKEEFNFNYKSSISEQSSLTNLKNLSNNNEEIAIKIIKQSMENTWKGLFELKINGYNNTQSKPNTIGHREPNHKHRPDDYEV